MRKRVKKAVVEQPTEVESSSLLEEVDDGPSFSDEESPSSIRSNRFAEYKKVAAEFKSFRPASEVLTRVKAVPTIFSQFDHATKVGGLPIERFSLVHGPSGEGKAVCHKTKVVTPDGWVEIGKLKVGDVVTAVDGTPTNVEGVYPQGRLPLFKVTFDDGTWVECCKDHLWFTTTIKERNRGRYVRGPRPERVRIPTGQTGEGSVKSLEEIMEDFSPHDHTIPLVGEVQFKPIGDLPLDPYLLGLYLGDGSSVTSQVCFCKPEKDLQLEFISLLPEGDTARDIHQGIRINGGGLVRQLRHLELLGLRSWEKFIPKLYLRASVEDRMALLRGLCDTDGSVVKDGGACEYSTTSFQLADDFVELARSLGAYVTRERRTTKFSYKGELKSGRPSERIRIYFNDNRIPFASKKNLAKWVGRGERTQYRSIVSIEPSRVEEAVCIEVAHPSRLFVVKDFIVTHNTYFTLGLLKSFLVKNHFACLIDAERTTPRDWVQLCMGDYLHHPYFFADRPKTYEKTVTNVRNFVNTLRKLRDAGKVEDDTSAIIVVDSIRKLVPADIFAKITESGQRKKGDDKLRDRSAQIKAAMNSAWMDELIPLLEETQTGMVVIARETEDPEADARSRMFGTNFKVGGGKALYYDASLVIRVERAKYVGKKDDENDEKSKTTVYGERHRVTIRKTKVAGKEDRQTTSYYHTSNGVLVPAGFDRARDVLELARRFEIVIGTSWLKFGRHKWQGEHAAVKKLSSTPELLDELESKVRERFDRVNAVEYTEDGEVID